MNVERWGWGRTALVGCCILVLGVFSWASTEQAKKTGAAASVDQALSDGERMYRKGILPSGKPMIAMQGGGASLPGTTFACASCHRRSGLGALEEGQRTPPINGAYLFQTLYPAFPGLSPSERQELPVKFQAPPLRPAYTDATLSRAIREGVGPTGRSFNPSMPRYALNDQDMAALVRYLKELCSNPSPGVTDESMALATVLTDDVSQSDRDAMLEALEGSVKAHNMVGAARGNMGVMVPMQVMYMSFRNWTLARWLLKGPPDTWRAQLENFYRAEPVFAVVGGISNNTWEPIHQFCEDHQIPCILPITDLPEISNTGYYTLYFSKGYYQEGGAVARYLNKKLGSTPAGNLVQVLGPGPEARALAAGFQDAWAGAGGKPIKTITLAKNHPFTGESLAGLLPPGKNSALLLWMGPDSYTALRSLAAAPNRPAFVFLSSTLLAERLWDLPSEARSFSYLAYPFREPGEKKIAPKMAGTRPLVVNKEYRSNDRRIASKMATLTAVLGEAVMRMERNFYRDYLLDLVDDMEVMEYTDYELLNFAPGQRYLSEGCYIMRLSEGPNPTLIRMSDWE